MPCWPPYHHCWQPLRLRLLLPHRSLSALSTFSSLQQHTSGRGHEAGPPVGSTDGAGNRGHNSATHAAAPNDVLMVVQLLQEHDLSERALQHTMEGQQAVYTHELGSGRQPGGRPTHRPAA